METNSRTGTKTTEFWLSLGMAVFGVVVACVGLWRGSDQLVQNGLMLAAGPTLGYTLSRGLVKRAASGGTLGALSGLLGNAFANADQVVAAVQQLTAQPNVPVVPVADPAAVAKL